MDRRKELKARYKARKVVGGVYRIVNSENGRFYLHSTGNIDAARNWFKMCLDLGTCEHPHLREDWKKYGAGAFSLEELDLLEKGETQTDAEFKNDIAALYAMWDEKLPREGRY